MGFRFRKKLAPGITLNWSKRGPSLSGRVGPRGMGVSVNTRGNVTGSVGTGGVRYEKRGKIPSAPVRTQSPTRVPVKNIVFVLAVLVSAFFVLMAGLVAVALATPSTKPVYPTTSHAAEVYHDFVWHHDCQWLHDHLLAMKNGQVPYDRVEEHVIKTKFWGCADVVPNWKVKMR